MPAPKPFTVVLLLALFLCVALYVLGVGLGATDNSRAGRSSMSKGERQRLRDRFLKPRPVKAEELQADCPLSNGVLTVERGRSCRVTIAEAGARGRTVEVAPAGPGSGGVSFEFTPKSQPGLPISEELLTAPQKLDVMKEGAELVVTCRNAATGGGQPGRCQVRLLGGP
ncbi:hypothetical protein [Hyalangium sp.]|uniref:hypothetical protein n=1 Tax=Hyalangium sp. TaxID=2028555 RepID=UPI002D70B5CF|nr:hypothetical protein [Hyalangium sp.]HYH96783.1 hypothetical protein [Hyalangium sp.]